jgi:GTP-binding protein
VSAPSIQPTFKHRPNAPRVVIVGRPNVGKSTLFNRLYGSRRALVHDQPGVTRDRLEQQVEWWVAGKRYILGIIDTGGLGGEKFADEIAYQVKMALERADVVVALFDAQAGYTPADEEIVQRMIRSGLKNGNVPILGAVNKVDDQVHEDLVHEFYAAGMDVVLGVSAEHSRGIEDLQKEIVDRLVAAGKLSPESEDREEDRIPRVAIVGRPNVGKSTFVNAVAGEERMITSPVAGTTVDQVDSMVAVGGKSMVLIDTAGIRRKSKTEQGVEVLSVVQARKALERANVALLMLDGESGASEQDEKIAGIIEEIGCSVILVINKWDTQRGKKDVTRESAAEEVRHRFGFLKYAPIMFVSAKERTGFKDLGELIYDILEQRRVKISTHEFTEWVRAESEIHNPYTVKFYLCHPVSRHPPTFVCHVSQPHKVHFSLQRHLVNAIREKWGFMGTPVRVVFVEAMRRKGPRRRLERDENGKIVYGKRAQAKLPEGMRRDDGTGAMEITFDDDLEADVERELDQLSDEKDLGRSIGEEDGSEDRE